MKTVFTGAELMEVALMCLSNLEPIPREYWCWDHDCKVTEWDLEKHKGCQLQEEGQWAG